MIQPLELISITSKSSRTALALSELAGIEEKLFTALDKYRTGCEKQDTFTPEEMYKLHKKIEELKLIYSRYKI